MRFSHFLKSYDKFRIMIREGQNPEVSFKRRANPGSFSPEELREIRIKTYRMFREGNVDVPQARRLTREIMGGYVLDPSIVPGEARPLVAPLPPLGVRR